MRLSLSPLNLSLLSPNVSLAGLQCVSGTVTVFNFIVQPAPGTVIGQIQPTVGAAIPLIQTQPTPLGGTSLASVSGRFATVCGRFTTVGGRTVLDVVVVNPGAPSPTGTPIPNQFLNLLLILLLTNPQLATAVLNIILSNPSVLGTANIFGTSGLISLLSNPNLLNLMISNPSLLSVLLGTSGTSLAGTSLAGTALAGAALGGTTTTVGGG